MYVSGIRLRTESGCFLRYCELLNAHGGAVVLIARSQALLKQEYSARAHCP